MAFPFMVDMRQGFKSMVFLGKEETFDQSFVLNSNYGCIPHEHTVLCCSLDHHPELADYRRHGKGLNVYFTDISTVSRYIHHVLESSTPHRTVHVNPFLIRFGPSRGPLNKTYDAWVTTVRRSQVEASDGPHKCISPEGGYQVEPSHPCMLYVSFFQNILRFLS